MRSSLEASAVAHEIKLPLSQILLSSQLLLNADAEGQSVDPRIRHQLEAIATAAQDVVTTIEKMRTLLRNVQTPHAPLNLAHVVRSALLYLKPTLNNAEVEVLTQGLEQPCPIKGDSSQLQIAMVNVLRNSIEALQTRNGERHIRVRLEQQGDAAWLEIADNGPGFPHRDDLLEPLQSGRSDGSGLGLFVVHTTLTHHHGSLELGRSDLGGAAVRLRLPQGDLPTSG